MHSRGKRIYVAILNQGAIRPELANLLTAISHDPQYRLTITYPADRPITNNRNRIVKDFLQSKASHLLMIDSDIVPHSTPLDLVRHNKDVVGYPCPQWRQGDIYWVAVDKTAEGYKPIPPERRNGIRQVDAIGTGCIMIKRKVLETLTAPFIDTLNDDGTLQLGEDFSFCEKATEAGFEIWCDWRAPCSHFKSIDLFEILRLIG
jgi:hypothetical protein